MVWASSIIEKASKSRKKLNRQNDDRIYIGGKTFFKKICSEHGDKKRRKYYFNWPARHI